MIISNFVELFNIYYIWIWHLLPIYLSNPISCVRMRTLFYILNGLILIWMVYRVKIGCLNSYNNSSNKMSSQHSNTHNVYSNIYHSYSKENIVTILCSNSYRIHSNHIQSQHLNSYYSYSNGHLNAYHFFRRISL